MSTQVMAAHVSLDVRMVLPGHARPSSRPRIVPSPICVSRVRRCLFGLASDPQDAVQHAAQELKRQAQMDSQRWSFDFALEKPLAGGQYVWSAVHDTPAEQPHASGDQSPSRMRQPQITGKSTGFLFLFSHVFISKKRIIFET